MYTLFDMLQLLDAFKNIIFILIFIITVVMFILRALNSSLALGP
jgi:hypothetical protein